MRKRENDLDDLRKLVEPAFSELERRLRRDMIDDLLRELSQQPEYHVRFPSLAADDVQRLSIVHQAMRFIETSEDWKRHLTTSFHVLSDRLALVSVDGQKQRLILEFLESLTPDKKQLRGDRTAFKRHLGFDVVSERYSKTVLHQEIMQKLAVDVIAFLTVETLKEYSDADDREKRTELFRYVLSTFAMQQFLLGVIQHARRWQNKVAAFEALSGIIEVIPESDRYQILDLGTVGVITQYCLNFRENTWIQIRALQLLSRLSRDESIRAFRTRLSRNEDDISDNLFVRKAIVELIGESFADRDGFEILEQLTHHGDKSEYVRIQLMKTLTIVQFPEARQILKDFARGGYGEKCPQVRAQAVIEWASLGIKATENSDEELLQEVVEVLVWAIVNGNDLLLQRVTLEEAAQLCNFREEMLDKGWVDAVDKRILDAISEVLSNKDSDIKLKRWAGEAWEQIVMKTSPEYKTLSQTLLPKINGLKEGEYIRIPRAHLPGDEDQLGRILAFFSRESFGIYAEMGSKYVKLIRGDRWRHRLWRIIHELRNPSPDKRRAFSHTVARDFTGTIRAHPGILAELTRTKVPGERFYIEHEGTWRRFIPLLDDYLSLSRGKLIGRDVKLFSSYGVTTIRRPEGWLSGVRGRLKMSWNYSRVATLRDANPLDREYPDPRAYIDTMRKEYGIATTFSPYSYRYEGIEYPFKDETIERLFHEQGQNEQAPTE